MSTCSICLNDVRRTRQNSNLRCGHLFHSTCLNDWKAKGKNTCPLCRKVFDVSNYKIVITIQNNYSGQSNVLEANMQSMFSIMDALDITFDVEDTIDVQRLLEDFGVNPADFDTSVFNTEGPTI